MIIVTGSIQARPDTLDELLALSLEHVRRSRGEPGCVSHAVHRDIEDPLRLVFLEQWADSDAIRTHFALPASGGFVKAAAALAAASPEVNVYDATPVRLPPDR
jgi:quinol monooxygenase YgiN